MNKRRAPRTAEEQFAPAVTIGVHCVDEFKTRSLVEVVVIGHARVELAEFVIDIFLRDQGDVVGRRRLGGSGSSLRHVRGCAQHEHGLVRIPEIESAKLDVVECGLRRPRLPTSCGSVRCGLSARSGGRDFLDTGEQRVGSKS